MPNTFHLSLDVPDLDEAVRFYRELFGTDPAKLEPGYAKFELTDPDVALALQEAARPALSHLGIRVETTEEVEAIIRAAQGRGADHVRRARDHVLLRPPGQGLGVGPRGEQVGDLHGARGRRVGRICRLEP